MKVWMMRKAMYYIIISNVIHCDPPCAYSHSIQDAFVEKNKPTNELAKP